MQILRTTIVAKRDEPRERLQSSALEERHLRLRRNVELVAFDALDAAQQSLLAEFRKDREFFGIVRSRHRGGPSVRVVDRLTAQLIGELLSGRVLSAAQRHALGDRGRRVLARLVLDGVLEVHDDSRFVSGPRAHHLVVPPEFASSDNGTVRHSLDRLSNRALQFAALLTSGDARHLAARLYAFNSQPVTPRLVRLMPSPAATAAHLRLDERTVRASLESGWHHLESEPANGWRFWPSRTEAHVLDAERVTFKLYLSPATESLCEVLPTMVEVLRRCDAPSFKVGSDLRNLVRPDKIIVYFAQLPRLLEVSAALHSALSGSTAQGVPFTTAIHGSALLSWGVDPAESTARVPWSDAESWRSWITQRLAAYVVRASRAALEVEDRAQFAVDRLSLEGIDTAIWSPIEEWRREFGDGDGDADQ